MKKFSFLLFLGFLYRPAFSQDSSKVKAFSVSAYLETYYLYDFNKPPGGNRPGFIYSHNRHNEFNINLGYIKAAYAAEKMRANFALAAGTYMNANYTAEPGVLKNLFEANAGVRLSKHKNIWLDAGVLPSHIGFESAVSKDCPVLSRSLAAENSPYFESGAKITYTTDSKKWTLSVLALNGWQRITRVSGNSLLSWGTQVQYKPSENVFFNYSTFIGTDKPDSARLNRLFHNFYGIFNINEKFAITTGFDIGTEEKFPGGTDRNTWFTPVMILKYFSNDKWMLALRGEYYSDKNGVIINTGTPNGFKTSGFSFNIDHSPAKNILIRVEARTLNSKDKIFTKRNEPVKNNSFLTSSLAVSF